METQPKIAKNVITFPLPLWVVKGGGSASSLSIADGLEPCRPGSFGFIHRGFTHLSHISDEYRRLKLRLKLDWV